MSGLGFDNIVQPTIAQRIVDQICQAISDGRYRPGDKPVSYTHLDVYKRQVHTDEEIKLSVFNHKSA